MPDLICDSSVIIALHQIGQLGILPAMSPKVIIPPLVARELARGDAQGDDALDVTSWDWVTIRAPAAHPALPSRKQMGPGESEVLWLALEIPGSQAVLDDGPARLVAEQLGISYTGTLGLLRDAKKRGLIPAVAPLLDELAGHAFNLSTRVRQNILKEAGELP